MSSVYKCINDTVLGSYVVVTVPWEVQVSMSGFSIHPYCKGSICFWSDDSIQEGYGAIWIDESTVLMCLRNSSWCAWYCSTKVSSTYLFHILGGAVLL